MKIPFHIPTITGSEHAQIEALLTDGSQLASDGKWSRACAEALRAHLGVDHVLFTPSGTAALEIAALLTVEPGDEVIVPSFTFVTSASAFADIGARPVFCDIRRDTLNIDEQEVSRLITPRTKAIVAVHYGGAACEMDTLRQIARESDIYLIEDAAQALTGRYGQAPLGSVGDLACFSFHSTKNYQCGEGGALIVNRDELVARAEIFREKGTNRNAFLNGQVDKYTWVDRGSSYVPSELTMAFLAGQLEHLDSIHEKRRLLTKHYDETLAKLARSGLLELQTTPNHCETSYHLYYVLLADGQTRDDLLKYLPSRGIGAAFHYVPLHSSARGSGLHDGRSLPVTDDVSQRLLRLPLYPSLREQDIDVIATTIQEFFDSRP